MEGITWTYKDNPYLKGTHEYDIWYAGFVHGLNSETKQNSGILLMLEELLHERLNIPALEEQVE